MMDVSDGKHGGYNWNDLADIAGRSEGHPVRTVFLPRAVPAALAPFAEVVSRLTGRPGMVSRGKVAELYHHDWVAKGPGLPLAEPVTFERGLPEALRWYREEGWLPASRLADRNNSTS
jgi:hypothetical protein